MEIQHKDAKIIPTGADTDFPGTFEVILSTPDLDRDGDMFLSTEWQQPLPDKITFDTDHGMSVATTVGSGVPSINGDGQLVVSGTYSSLKQAQDVRTLVNEGHIDRTSVAYRTIRTPLKGGKSMISRELLNGAFVAVPANDAAKILSSKGVKAGARNSASDSSKIQQIHDLTVELGATTDTSKSARTAETKSVAGSLEATQDRARDALQDAYPGAWVYLRATLPEGDGGVLVYCVENPDTYDSDEYKQSYLDDGKVITLTGERSAVDVMEIITPDPDEDAADSGATETPDAGAQAPAPGAKAAPVEDTDSTAVTAADVEAKVLDIFADSFI